MPERKVIPRSSSFADLCWGGYRALGLAGENWAITSVALVMQTQARTSVRVAVIRVFINVISATVALVALHLGGSTTIPSFAVALLVVGLFCYLTKLDEGIRSAYICVVIIIGADRFADLSPPIDRVAAVTVGSILGVVVSWIFAKIGTRSSARMHGEVAR